MKTYIILLKMTFALIWITSNVMAQCPNDNSPYGTISSLAPGQTSTVYCMYGGEYATVSVVSGAQYTFSTCGGSWDSQLTLRTTTGTYLAYNDDGCGLQSQINWTATFSGQVRVLLDKYSCSNYNSCMNLNVTRGAAAANPCNSSSSLSCGTTGSFSLLSGSGSWNPTSGPWGTPGNEKVFTFTPTISGVHTINVSSNYSWVDLFIKTGACNGNSWTFIDDIYSTATNYVTLTAGTSYSFLIDDENTSASSGTISITCPSAPATNPCASISTLTCDQSESFNLASGTGAWNPTGPWGTPGNESVFSYTPSVTGSYDIQVTSNSSYVDLFYKSGSCGASGWTYVNDIYSSETNSVTLTGGTTYYFLIDDENTSASSGSISVSCPCLGNTVDAVLTLNGNVSVTNNTLGACDDCGLRSSEDITYEVNIPCAGTYTFETCGATSWDTYLYLTSAPCSGTLATNDDNCGLQSSITYSFNAGGTYYVTVEGFSSYAAGQFGLSISKSCDLGVTASSDTYACGNNISCFGASDGSAIANVSGGCGNINYQWSNGSGSSTVNQLAAGTYNVVVTDEWQCSANASIILTAPAKLIADAGEEQTVYYGYTPFSCADISGSAQGGCAEYSYSWSANGSVISSSTDVNICPSSSTNYELTVTDQNGCEASDNVDVCVINVICYAGRSNVQKVEMCHVSPGNSGHRNTICINEDAVAAHLAHGCTLGSCEEVNFCSTNNSNLLSRFAESNDITNNQLNVSPNPFVESFEIDFTVETADNYLITLYSIQGELIKVIFNGDLGKGEHLSLEFPSSLMESGLYLLRSNNSNGNYNETIRIVKQ